jgi:uncharacterized protein
MVILTCGCLCGAGAILLELMNDKLADEIAALLAANHVMTLATAGASGPHAANLFYACDGLALIWVSAPDTRHSLDIAADAHVAATVAPDTSDFAAIRGVQIAGLARKITATDERKRHLVQLEARYSFLRELAAKPVKLREAYDRSEIYRLQPARIVLIDNSKGFGHKETLELTP